MTKYCDPQTKDDITEDFENLLTLFLSSQDALEVYTKKLGNKKSHIPSLQIINKQILTQKKAYIQSISSLKKLQSILQKPLSLSQKNVLEQQYTQLFDSYRTLQSMLSGIIAASAYQSPTFAHSTNSLAGIETGEIIPHYDDYKRDEHTDGKTYANAFKTAYLKGVLKFRTTTYLTNSGMAALTTIINYLVMEKKISGPILLGASSYFQNKELIEKTFPKVTKIHEHDTEKIKKYIITMQPQALFFDSLCNSFDIALPNLPEIISMLKKYSKQDVYLIIDNTCLASSFQPLQYLSMLSSTVHIIVFESLNKYYQFGTDRVMGGVIYTTGYYTDGLFSIRQHSGTIISDTSAHALPIPNKTILMSRLTRHQRNTTLVTVALQKAIEENPALPITAVVSPLLSTHPSSAWTKDYRFLGSFFTFTWQQKYDHVKTYTTFIKLVLREAKKRNLPIVEGTSFGMNTTRIYLTAPNTTFGKPFVRISVGTEPSATIQILITVLLDALRSI